MHRVALFGALLIALSGPSLAQRSSSLISVPLQKEGGTFTVPVLINGAIRLNFIIDSGATDVSIPADVVLTLVRTGTLQPSDFIGAQTYKLADGSTVPSATFRLRSLSVGIKVIENVVGSIAPVEGPLLLGQSFLTRFKSWSINNVGQALILEVQDATSGDQHQNITRTEDDSAWMGKQTSLPPPGSLENQAISMVIRIESLASESLPSVIGELASLYDKQVVYYDHPTSRDEVLADKVRYFTRWPRRAYTIVPGSLKANCNEATAICEISGLVAFSLQGNERRAEGEASFSYGIAVTTSGLRIRSESGSVVSRK
jgi:hypothetical protein